MTRTGPRLLLALTLAGALGACTADTTAPAARPTAPRLSTSAAVPGSYVVGFKGNGIPGGFAAQVKALGGTVTFSHAGAGMATVTGLSDAAAAQLAASSGVADMQADDIVQLDQDAMATPRATSGAASPTDPTTAFFYPIQWDYHAIGADRAWAAGVFGSPSVRVAILDTGIDDQYLDLNGLVDLAHSRSFVPSDDALVGAFFPGRALTTDLHFHGTHVASTVSSHAFAVAGVTSNVTLMAVKVLSVTGSGATSGVLGGILWASDNGADVINMSLGSYFTKAKNGRFIGFVNRVVNYANKKGVTVVVAAGNAAIDLDHDGNGMAQFCNVTNVICVSATGPTSQESDFGPWTNIDAFAPYSNFGRSAINVAAPGGNGSSFIWQACSGTSLQIPICQTGTYAVGLQGTSMAAPHTAALAALLVERLGRNPGLIRARIQQSADDLGQRGTDPFYGKGRIDVARAMGL